MPKLSQARLFSGYASQTEKWDDSDLVIACNVECQIDGVTHVTMFMCEDPLSAIKYAQENFEKLTWKEVK